MRKNHEHFHKLTAEKFCFFSDNDSVRENLLCECVSVKELCFKTLKTTSEQRLRKSGK